MILISDSEYLIVDFNVFPSPCGVLMILMTEAKSRMVKHLEFPSPCGVLMILIKLSFYNKQITTRFRPHAGF